MQDFIYNIPTTVYFGKGQIVNLPSIIRTYGTKVLLIYGGGSIKRNGIYDNVISLLNVNNIEFCELSGVEPNPRVSTVRKGINICRENNIDIILAVGGGSTIDCAKAVAAGIKYDGDVWDLCIDRRKIKDALPIVAIPTMAATGSEMDSFSVITNEETQDKKGTGSSLLIPRAAICDPTYTFSVSAFQTASGTADIISHILETYFRDADGAFIAERTSEGLLKTCFHYGKTAIEEPDNYEARANLMWASNWAINGFLSCGLGGSWVVHPIEHQVSAYYDVPHGAGLAVLTPHWFRKILSNPLSLPVFRKYGVNVWGLNPALSDMELAEASIRMTEKFFASIHLPNTLHELGVTGKEYFDVMAEKALRDGAGNSYFPLNKADILDILEAAY